MPLHLNLQDSYTPKQPYFSRTSSDIARMLTNSANVSAELALVKQDVQRILQDILKIQMTIAQEDQGSIEYECTIKKAQSGYKLSAIILVVCLCLAGLSAYSECKAQSRAQYHGQRDFDMVRKTVDKAVDMHDTQTSISRRAFGMSNYDTFSTASDASRMTDDDDLVTVTKGNLMPRKVLQTRVERADEVEEDIYISDMD